MCVYCQQGRLVPFRLTPNSRFFIMLRSINPLSILVDLLVIYGNIRSTDLFNLNSNSLHD